MKKTILTLTMLLVAGTTAACGGMPTDASQADFCDVYVGGMDDDTDGDEFAKELKKTGIPSDASDSEVNGLKILLKISKKDEDDQEDAYNDLGDDDKKDVDAFLGYAAETCSDEMDEKLKEQMPEMPEMPEMPTAPMPS